MRPIIPLLLLALSCFAQQRGNIDWTQLSQSARQGNGSKGLSFGGGPANAGDSVVFDPLGNAVDGGPPITTLSGTHAARPAASSLTAGALYYETDRTVLYQDQNVNGLKWMYVAGQMTGTLSPNSKPIDLGSNDAGFLFAASDYLHLYRWSGGAWAFAPGDPGSGWGAMSMDTNPPRGGLWQLCDGTTVGIAQSNGTISNTATPNLTQVGGNYPVLMAGGFTGGLAASATQWGAGAKTDTESAHVHDLANHGHSFSVVNTVTVQSGTGVSVAGAQSGTTGIPVPNVSGAGSAHSHNLSNANAVLVAPGESVGGMPYRVALNFYIRR